jgi:hypothetical protein
VQIIAVYVRKAIGLGGQALTGGSPLVPMYSGAWPTASLGPMGFQGAVKLGFKVELDAIADPVERQKRFDELVDESLERGSALSLASLAEVDEVSSFLFPVIFRPRTYPFFMTLLCLGYRPGGDACEDCAEFEIGTSADEEEGKEEADD